MGFLWPVYKETGLKKTEADLSEPEKIRIAEDIERDQTANVQRGLKIDNKAIELGIRMLKGVKGRDGMFDEFQRTATAKGA